MHGAAVHEDLALDIAFDGRDDCFHDRGIVAQACKDNVRFFRGLFQTGCYHCLAWGQLRAEICGSLLGSVEDYQRPVEVAFLNKVLDHTLACL